MKVLDFNEKEGIMKLKLEYPTDLYVLSKILSPGDLVRGRTTRRVKRPGSEEKSGDKGHRIPVTLTIKVEHAAFQDSIIVRRMRITGKIVAGPEDIVKIGSYHTINVSLGDIISIKKHFWTDYHHQLLEEAERAAKIPPLLVLSIDIGEVSALLISNFQTQWVYDDKERIPRKSSSTKSRPELILRFFSKIAKNLERLVNEYHVKHTIITSPGSLKEQFVDYLEKNYKQLTEKISISLENTSIGGRSGVNEILSSGKLDHYMNQYRVLAENKLLEEFVKRMSQGKNNIAYGIQQIAEIAPTGAIETLLILDSLLYSSVDISNEEKSVSSDTQQIVTEILRAVEQRRGKVWVIPKNSDNGKQLEKFGGIIALLRYEIDWQ